MTKNNIAVLVTAVILVAATAGCGKSPEERREEVLECSRVNSQAELIALCLVSDHNWKDSAADAAGAGRAHELDSIRQFQEDSAWNVDRVQHRADVRGCSGGDQMRECLRSRGWPDARALRTADSLWAADAGRHRDQVRRCAGQRAAPIASCLVLNYRWSNERALATQDSVVRARLAQ
jgi:hypothetical protein